MRICIVTHKLIKGDGQGRVNYEIVQTALQNGDSVLIISTEIDEVLLKNHKVEWIEIKTNYLPTNLLKYQLFALLSTITLKKEKYDFLLVNGFITWKKSDMNIVHFVHSSWLNSAYHPFRETKNLKTFYQYIYSLLNAKLERKSFKDTEKVVAVSNKVKQELLSSGLPENKIKVINNGVDITEFTPQKKVGLIVQNNILKGKIILFAGDIKSTRKNLDTVIKSLLYVPNVHLVVAGKKEGSIYPKMAEDFGLNDRIHFIGYRKDVAYLMSQVDIFVFPTRYDPFSLVVLEAMASGTAVITTKEAGVSSLLRNTNKQAGIVLEDPNNERELANAMNKILQDENLQKQFSTEGRLIAQENSWVNVSQKYLQEIIS
ncbi:glycosyltransferase family 4 protein [Bacillus sp. B1-b2]|uniref:glycosyltransferase family 4 protein n=1 Tax=Bacillus sp. B1-b2 TaxID=2653201 RepID=UPI0012621A4D|nr:glycosyltransferase family 4 protein [Bacillus sp. B1-b2]KAB7671730.1 glycosyltransferase family 4 protein [Bacillus sp. B1-b2]